MANIGYAFSDLFTLGLGYRYLDVDFEDDDFLIDVKFQGPVIGAAFTW
jgi:opacity protein-like surface antigen